MKVTVILCTYNRCKSLAKALDSLAAQQVPESIAWEVLAVDNNSSDNTRGVIEEFCRRYPGRFRYLFEPQQGKSNALNAGVREAHGDILAFIDDDATAEPAWLESLTRALHEEHWAGAGGRTLPDLSSSLPNWLALTGPCNLGGVVGALFDLGDKPCELRIAPYGTNMAFRKKMFDVYGRFRTDLGPRPDSRIRNEDTEFGHRLMAGGERLRYEPSALVHHTVMPERIDKRYLLEWWFDYGRAMILEEGRRPNILGIPWRYLKIPRVVVRVLAPRAVRWMLVFNPLRRFYYKCKVWEAVGELSEICGQGRGTAAEKI